MADSSIRSVAVRSLSCDFMDAVRSVRSRSLRSAMCANLRRLPIVLADEPRVDSGRHLDVLGYQVDVGLAARCGCHPHEGRTSAALGTKCAQHAGIGDGEWADRAETERLGVLPRLGDRVLDGPGAGLALQFLTSFRRQCPLDVGYPEPLRVRDVTA